MLSNELKQKQKKAERLRQQKKNDIMVNRIAAAFILVCAGIVVMLFAKKTIDNEVAFITRWLTPLLIISGAAFIGSIVFFALRTKRRTDESELVFTKWNVLGAGIVFFGSMLFYRLTFDASLVVLELIAVGALYLVFNLFKADFFIYSVLTAAGVLLLRVGQTAGYSSVASAASMLCNILCVVLAVAGLILAVMLISGKGSISFKERRFSVGGWIWPVFVASGLLAAGGIVGFFAPAFLTYVIAAMLVAYLAIAIAYVIKMM